MNSKSRQRFAFANTFGIHLSLPVKDGRGCTETQIYGYLYIG